MTQALDLSQTITGLLERYFDQLNGEKPVAVYQMVMRQVEAPMLACVMAQAGNNQVLAAEILGISRSTLRKKLLEYNLLPR